MISLNKRFFKDVSTQVLQITVIPNQIAKGDAILNLIRRFNKSLEISKKNYNHNWNSFIFNESKELQPFPDPSLRWFATFLKFWILRTRTKSYSVTIQMKAPEQ